MIGAKEWEHGSALGPGRVRPPDPAYPALHRPLGLLASLPTLLGLKGTMAHNAAVSLVWMLSALAEILAGVGKLHWVRRGWPAVHPAVRRKIS